MIPLLVATIAGALSAKMRGAQSKKDSRAQLLQQNAQRLGGNTDMVGAVRAGQAADAQEGRDLTNVFVNHLSRSLADKNNALESPQAPTAPVNSTADHDAYERAFMPVPEPDDDPHNQYMRSFGR